MKDSPTFLGLQAWNERTSREDLMNAGRQTALQPERPMTTPVYWLPALMGAPVEVVGGGSEVIVGVRA
jgi:hypothetical protein